MDDKQLYRAVPADHREPIFEWMQANKINLDHDKVEILVTGEMSDLGFKVLPILDGVSLSSKEQVHGHHLSWHHLYPLYLSYEVVTQSGIFDLSATPENCF